MDLEESSLTDESKYSRNSRQSSRRGSNMSNISTLKIDELRPQNSKKKRISRNNKLAVPN